MMAVPLSRHLTRFGSLEAAVIDLPQAIGEQPSAEPKVAMPSAEFEARLAAAAERGRTEAAQAAEVRLKQIEAEHQTALVRAADEARAACTAGEADLIVARLDAGFTAVQAALSTRVAKVLQPLLAQAVIDRAVAAFVEALDRLLKDAARPALTVKGPRELLAAVEAVRGARGIAFAVADSFELSLATADAHVETCLAAALTALATAEGDGHV